MFCDRCLIDIAEAEHLNHVLDHIDKMETRIMTAFGEVQAAVDLLATQASDIASQLTTIETDLGPALAGTVDLSALQGNLATAQTALTSLAALVPVPAPTPEPEPAPGV